MTHRPNCQESDKILFWHCIQCGENESAEEFCNKLADLRRQLIEKNEILKAIARRAPIMGSTGEYRRGQEHALEECHNLAKDALAVK